MPLEETRVAGPAQGRVRVETNPPDDAWESYVRAHPDASLFHHLAWQRSLERTFRSYRPCHRIAWRGDSVVGVLPLYRVPGLPFGCSLISTPLGVYGGVCADDEEAGQALIDDAAAYGRTIGAKYVELRCKQTLAIDARPAGRGSVNVTLCSAGRAGMASVCLHRSSTYLAPTRLASVNRRSTSACARAGDPLQGPPVSRNGIELTTVPNSGLRTMNAGSTPTRPSSSTALRYSGSCP